MAEKMRVVVVGGVAAGPKIAAKVKRLKPDAEVTLVERGEILSYAGCGLPYYISGEVPRAENLREAMAGVIRDADYFQRVKGFTALTRTEAIEIDREGKRVRVRDLRDGREWWMEYDFLALATGAAPVIPPIPGLDLENIFTIKQIDDVVAIRALIDKGVTKKFVVIGAGLIGLEAAEVLTARGAKVTLVEMLPQVLGSLDWEMARQVEMHLEEKGVEVLTGCRCERIEGAGKVESVMVGDRRVPADAVIVAIGVRPNMKLAQEAGLQIGRTGGIAVDEYMRTSDPSIFAAGDCVEVHHLVSGEPAFIPLGSTSNKQGRVAAVNICGGGERFPGVVGSTIVKVFDYAIGFTGLNERDARACGFDVVTCLVTGPDKAHYYPTKKTLMLKMVANRATGKLLGIQVVGPGAGDKRIDVAATALTAGMTVDQVSELDLCYAPPYSPAMDLLINAANVIKNKMAGHMQGISPTELKEWMDEGRDFIILDVRTPTEVREKRLAGSAHIPISQLRDRIGELSVAKPVVVHCASALRAYEAARILEAHGHGDVRVADGCIGMWPYDVQT
jgi:NADPH-dependent 2,4-dienoyl-CoA reductase/sulfur reductase-like enzyme/rhodanese-related sulfurtransferase